MNFLPYSCTRLSPNRFFKREQDSHLEGKKNKLCLGHKETLNDEFTHCKPENTQAK